MWRELKCEHGTVAGKEDGLARIFCRRNGVWVSPQLYDCYGSTAALFAELREVLDYKDCVTDIKNDRYNYASECLLVLC